MKDLRSILFISDGSRWSGIANEFLCERFSQVDWVAWDYGTPRTRTFDNWRGCDILLSFKADFIIPDRMLSQVREAAINFHPSIPQYRGIGGYRYALDSGREDFGATCHFVTPELDAGPIIEVSRFPIRDGMTEQELQEQTAETALEQFCRIVTALHNHVSLLVDESEVWGSRLYLRAELSEYRLKTDRRVGAVSST